MPVAVIAGTLLAATRQVLWYLVQTAVAYASFESVAYLWEKIVDALRSNLQQNGKLTEPETDAFLESETLKILSQLGVTAVLFRAKVPTTLARKLGIRGTPTAASKSQVSASTKAVEKKLLGVPVSKIQQATLLAFLGSLAASLPWLPGTIQQFGDQATFNAKNANNYYEGLFGIRPFYEPPRSASPGTFSENEFSDYAVALEKAGVRSIKNPTKTTPVAYSQGELSELVDYVYGVENLAGRSTTSTALKKALAQYLSTTPVANTYAPSLYDQVKTASATKTATAAPAAQSVSAAGAAAAVAAPVKVFTGIVSQGTLGQTLAFTARQDDLIENGAELRDAARNNIAPFLASLPGRVVYELRVVSSVTTRDGFTQRGTAQQIVTGYYKNGNPKYKTVVNKFAVMNLYILTDRGTRTKLTQVILGPTDAVRFQPSAGDISSVEAEIKASIITQEAPQFSGTIESTAQNASAGELSPALDTEVELEPKAPIVVDGFVDTGYRFYRREENGRVDYAAMAWAGNVPYGYEPISEAEYRRATGDTRVYGASGYTLIGNTPWTIAAAKAERLAPNAPDVVSATVPAAPSASTLYEWYSGRGETLPSVAERSKLYESLGLGKAAYYTGTAEQNTKLLNALKL